MPKHSQTAEDDNNGARDAVRWQRQRRPGPARVHLLGRMLSLLSFMRADLLLAAGTVPCAQISRQPFDTSPHNTWLCDTGHTSSASPHASQQQHHNESSDAEACEDAAYHPYLHLLM